MKSLIKAVSKNLGLHFVAAVVFFLCSGRLLVLRGLFYFAVSILGAVFNNCILAKHTPAVLAARVGAGEGTAMWDKLFVFPIFLLRSSLLTWFPV